MKHRHQARGWSSGHTKHSVCHGTHERGIALVVALVMLIILGFLGTFALNTSTTELHIAGNYRNEQFAYYNANVLQGWGPNNANIRSAIVTENTSTTFPIIVPAGGTTVTVKFVCVGPPPPGMNVDANSFSALHYLVTTSGTGPNGQSEFSVESEMIQLGPKSDPDCTPLD